MKLLLVSTLLCVLLTSCHTAYQVVSRQYDYTETIDFTIDKIEESTSISTGNGSWNASRGNKFVFVFLTFNNNVKEKQQLNFDDFLLLNPRTKTKHKAEWAMIVGPFNVWGKIDSYIRKGDEKQRKLVFLYPEEDKAEILLVKDRIIEIEYAR